MQKKLVVLGSVAIALVFAATASALGPMRCESLDGRYHECGVGGTGMIALTKQLSDSSCIEGQSWGVRNGNVWVDSGCRGEFTLTSSPAVTFVASPRTVTCESHNENRENCKADTKFGVALYRQLSDAACVRDRTWGVNPDGIWVTEGCRGEFAFGTTHVAQAAMAGAIVTAPQTVVVAPMVSSAPSVFVQPSTVVCESTNNGRSHCRMNTASGIILMRQLSDNACVRDRTWGVDRDGVWVTDGCRAEFAMGSGSTTVVTVPSIPQGPTLVCESMDGNRNRCAMSTSMGVTLLRQISDSNCVLNQTWGVDADGVWVDRGCRAEFVAGGASIDAWGNAPSSARLLCESKDGKRNVCPTDTRLGVAVVRQLSESACVLNSTWGFDTNGIWVTAGCRAEFIMRR